MGTRLGYLFVDHRASPGMTEDQARFNGYDPGLAKEGRVFEADTLTCAHCRGIVVKNMDRTRERAHCHKCNHYICDGCEYLSRQPDYVHTPFVAKMEADFERVLATPATSYVPSLDILKGNTP